MKRGIQGGGFPATGRPRYNKNAIGRSCNFFDLGQHVVRETKRIQVQFDGLAIQHTQHDGFPKLRRQTGHTKIDFAAVRHDAGNATILRATAFVRLEVCHDLDTAHHVRRQAYRGTCQLVERPVHTCPNLEIILERLEMNITGTIPDGCHQHSIHKGGYVPFIPGNIDLFNVLSLQFSVLD